MTEDKIEERRRGRHAEKEHEAAGWRQLVITGERVKRFLESDVWLRDLEPMLAKMQDDAAKEKGWHPGSTKTLDETALTNAYYSAIEATIYQVARKLNTMIEVGEDAKGHLKKTAEKENAK